MARSVYYDPFGSRVSGYHAGMQDEMALQDNIRRARAQDFDYENFKPLELQAAQRQEGYNQYADPYLRRALGLNERTAQANTFGTEANALGLAGDYTGNYQPLLGLGQNYLGLPQMPGSPEQLMGVQDRYNREFLAQRGDAERDWQYRLSNLGLNERQQAQAEMQWRTMSPTAQLYALIQSGALQGGQGGQGGQGSSPVDFAPYGAQPAPAQGGQVPAYQYPIPSVLQGYGVPPVDAQGRPDIGAEAF